MLEDFVKLVTSARSVRRFDESHAISREELVRLVGLARFAPSSGNLQPLRFVVCADPEKNEQIFPCLGWAGHLKDWPGPEPGERPTGYVFVVEDQRVLKDAATDVGIAAQTIFLGIRAAGLGGCMIASVDWDRIRKIFDLPLQYRIRLALALGKPAETVVVEDLQGERGHRYWRDGEGVHHVPKRVLSDLIL